MDVNEDVIELHRGELCWWAAYSGPHAQRIEALFGTRALPTAWTPDADPRTVWNGIAYANPGVTVRFREAR